MMSFKIAFFAALSMAAVSADLCTNSKIGYEACLESDLCNNSPGCEVTCGSDNLCCQPCVGQASLYKSTCCTGSSGDAPVDSANQVCENTIIGYEACLEELCEGAGCQVDCGSDCDCLPCAGSEAVYKTGCCGGASGDVPAETEADLCTNAESVYQGCLESDLCTDSPDCSVSCDTDAFCCQACAGQASLHKTVCCAGGDAGTTEPPTNGSPTDPPTDDSPTDAPTSDAPDMLKKSYMVALLGAAVLF